MKSKAQRYDDPAFLAAEAAAHALAQRVQSLEAQLAAAEKDKARMVEAFKAVSGLSSDDWEFVKYLLTADNAYTLWAAFAKLRSAIAAAKPRATPGKLEGET